MSGLYHVVFGTNTLAKPFLEILKIDPRIVPRFRDCFLYHDGQSIVIYTRTGGGNRIEFKNENQNMRKWPGYLRDEDDSFDTTYALFHFAIPDEIKKDIPILLDNGWGVDPPKRWQEALATLRNRK
jgi:hypothetical protein